MFKILKNLTFHDLPTEPEITGKPKLSDDLQQTIALLSGWDKSTRRLIFCNAQGVLHTTSPPIKGIINQVSGGVGSNVQLTENITSEVLIRANPANGGRIWVNIGVAAAPNTGYPLDGGEWINWAMNNLINLHLHFVNADDYAVIVYTK